MSTSNDRRCAEFQCIQKFSISEKHLEQSKIASKLDEFIVKDVAESYESVEVISDQVLRKLFNLKKNLS